MGLNFTEYMAKSKHTPPLKVAELFAGVGGFRIGLEQAKGYEVVFGNQWEPGTKKQHAFEIYATRFKTGTHSNQDIATVKVGDIPDHDLLVGGFPCQDYSVARTLSHATGIIGKKGVLWWQIHRILKEKQEAEQKRKGKQPRYLLLENVDRLLKSPVKQRGRDFALMLASLSQLGYIVEWRVINAAEYGMPQRRRRVFILGYLKGTPLHTRISKLKDPFDWLLHHGTIAKAFPVKTNDEFMLPPERHFTISGDLADISERFRGTGNESPFENTGIIVNGKIYTAKTYPAYSGKRTTLGDIVLKESEIPAEYFIAAKDMPRWKYLKGAKKEPRQSKLGHTYNYSEGPIAFPDPLNKPARTIITGEGGRSPSRFKHVIVTKSGRYRRLTPIELERANMFPDKHTEGATDARRAFFMGNALVVGVVERLGKELKRQIIQKPSSAKKELCPA
ncbi:MAG: DNA (cytosine-5-)-methyltransferase [Elusimicrobiales bacterium]|nr:DNA (cytosine-5-)-methyltransferase [Elusimicrobiales bacterium]